MIQNKDSAGYTRCSKFTLKIADDAHQVKIDPDATSMEKVNDHCLLYIMSHLTLMDAISVCKTSTRMQSAGQLYYRKYANFSFGMPLKDTSISEANLPIILEAIGDHITSIDWHFLTGAQFDLLIKHCPNVTEITLTSVKRDFGAMLHRNKQFFVNLKKLHIKSSTNICDIHVKAMMSGNAVKTLDLQGCNRLRGKFFTKLNHKKLRNITFTNCPRMREHERFPLSKWTNRLFNLKSDICCSYVPCLSLPAGKLDRLKELQLDFSCFVGVTEGLNFSGLVRLKKITLTRKNQYNYIDSNKMINGLAQISSLESVNIQGIVVDSNTIRALRSIKMLKFLRLGSVDNKIGRNLYEMLREHLPTLQELSMYFGRYEVVTGKPIMDMVAGMPMLQYFAHSSINWEWLDGIRQATVVATLDQKTPLKIGVSENIFNDPKKVSVLGFFVGI